MYVLDVYVWVEVPWCVWESGDNFVEPVLLHLYVVLGIKPRLPDLQRGKCLYPLCHLWPYYSKFYDTLVSPALAFL